jgi:hypothetical protein
LRAYEAATLWAVRRGLRSGRLFLPYAGEYRGKEQLLMPSPDWERTRDAFLERRQLPAKPEPFLDRVVAQVEAGMQALDEAVAADAVYVSKNGIHLKLGDDPEVTVESNVTEALRKRLVAGTKDRVGTVQLPELMLAMDSEAAFSHQLLGRAPRSADELLSSYAGVLAAAANVEASAMALMIPGLRAPAISRVLRLLEGEPALRRASDAVVEWMRALPLVKGWGRGFEASADMVSLDTSRHVYLALQDPRRRRSMRCAVRTVRWKPIYFRKAGTPSGWGRPGTPPGCVGADGVRPAPPLPDAGRQSGSRCEPVNSMTIAPERSPTS